MSAYRKHKKLFLSLRKKLLYFEAGQTLEQVSKRGCGVFILSDIQNLTGLCPGQCAPTDSAWRMGGWTRSVEVLYDLSRSMILWKFAEYFKNPKAKQG